MNPAVLALLAAILWAAGYAVTCAIWPFANCRRCHGSGKRTSPSGKAFRTCPRCHGSSKRLRLGRRALNHVSATQRKATQ